MGLSSVHRLCVVGSLGEKRLRSYRLLETWGKIWREEEGGETFLPRPYEMGSEEHSPRNSKYGPQWDSASVLLHDYRQFGIRLSFSYEK